MSYIGKKNGNPNTDFLEAGGELENHDLVNVDSSGNVGIGTSSPVRKLDVHANGVPPFRINRTTSDGNLVELRKDGTSVGSIGVNNGSLEIEGDGDRTGLYFGLYGQVLPKRNQSLSNNQVDLGASSYKFRNLYLSGGVYLGGTGSANYLDDYEEGTWTPSLDGSTATPTVSYNTQTKGSYTKIGNLVHARGTLQISSRSGGSGSALIKGLPFNVSTTIDTYAQRSGGVVVGQADNFTSGNYPSTGQVSTSSNWFYLRQIDHSSGTTTIYASAFQTNTLVRFSVTYVTDS